MRTIDSGIRQPRLARCADSRPTGSLTGLGGAWVQRDVGALPRVAAALIGRRFFSSGPPSPQPSIVGRRDARTADMDRIVIVGNSGSGKTSLARQLSQVVSLAHLDLDEIAWKEADPPVRESLAESAAQIDAFTARNPRWIVEGCYASLVEYAARMATHMVFLNLGVEECVRNCRSRPWEPGKYPSKEAQDGNLEMLVDWVRSYDSRDDEFSLKDHRRVFASFSGAKVEITTNGETDRYLASCADRLPPG